PRAGAAGPASAGANGRHTRVAAAQPSQVTWNADARARATFCTTTADAYARVATTSRTRPVPLLPPDRVVASPIRTQPTSATPQPASRPFGKPSRSTTPASRAISSGPVFTIMADVLTST